MSFRLQTAVLLAAFAAVVIIGNVSFPLTILAGGVG